MPLSIWDGLWRLGRAVFRTGVLVPDWTKKSKKKSRIAAQRVESRDRLYRIDKKGYNAFNGYISYIKSPLDREEGPLAQRLHSKLDYPVYNLNCGKWLFVTTGLKMYFCIACRHCNCFEKGYEGWMSRPDGLCKGCLDAESLNSGRRISPVSRKSIQIAGNILFFVLTPLMTRILQFPEAKD